MESPINWHRMFGLLLMDFFTGSPFVVEMEKDLSLKKQLLDVVVLRRTPGPFHGQLPDGFDNLVTHNLITFKSHHEVLDDWTLKELTGHYVNYRKQVSPSFDDLLPESKFGMYAVCARYPRRLARSSGWRNVGDGVADYTRGTDIIRVIVLAKLPEVHRNALLHLLSAMPNRVKFGASHFEKHSNETSTLVGRVYTGYFREGWDMPYTMEDFKREIRQEVLAELTPEERLEGMSPQERVAGMSPREIAAGIDVAGFLQSLPPEEIERCLKQRRTRRKQK